MVAIAIAEHRAQIPNAITCLLAPTKPMAIAGDDWRLPTLMASNQPAAMAIIRPARQHRAA